MLGKTHLESYPATLCDLNKRLLKVTIQVQQGSFVLETLPPQSWYFYFKTITYLFDIWFTVVKALAHLISLKSIWS